MKLFLDHRWLFFLAFVFIAGCANAPVQPRETVAIAYTAIGSVADLVAIAYRDGHIDSVVKEKLKIQLQKAQDFANQANDAISADVRVIENCAETGREMIVSDCNLARARLILTAVREALPAMGVE